jgi:hypothetical protein
MYETGKSEKPFSVIISPLPWPSMAMAIAIVEPHDRLIAGKLIEQWVMGVIFTPRRREGRDQFVTAKLAL